VENAAMAFQYAVFRKTSLQEVVVNVTRKHESIFLQIFELGEA
jgi:hypothetical protein